MKQQQYADLMTHSQPVQNQQRATDPNENIAVFASAGTGKTHLLVQRILNLLLNDVDPAHILAITFTRKAATEMRERLMKTLADWARYDDQQLKAELQKLVHPYKPDSMAKAKGLYEQMLFAQHDIRVTTFHAYCQDILKQFAIQAGVPAGFQITDTAAKLKQDACERLYQIAHQGTEPELANALFELLQHCGSVHNVNDLLITFIDSCNDWRSFTEDQTDPISYASNCLHTFLFSDQTKEDPCDILSKLRHDLKQYQSYLNQYASRSLSTMLANKNNVKELIQDIKPFFLTKKNEPRKLKSSKSLEKSLGQQGMLDFIRLHRDLCDVVIQQIDILRKEKLFAFNQAWFKAGQRLLNEYQDLKFSRHVLDFDDLEWHTYLLLCKYSDAAWIQYKLDQRIKHILIDEFQDTNPTQWNLLLPLLEELAANLQKGDKSLFFVGDTKQSIYRFHRANPELQLTALTWAQKNLNAELLETDLSFRSSPVIIELVNKVFSGDEEKPLLDKFRSHEAKHARLWGTVQISPLIVPEGKAKDHLEFRNPLTQARINNEFDYHYREGQTVAEQIKALIKHSTPICDHDQQARAIRYSDMIILARRRIHLPQLELALREKDIPYRSISDNEFLKQLEIQDILALLAYLVQPYNDLALAQVLRSPCFGVSDNELMKIADYETESWHEKLKIHATEIPESLLGQAYQQLQKWRDLANRIPVHDLLDRIYFDINILQRYKNSCPLAKRSHVLANLTHLLQLALDMDAGRYSNIQSFLSSIQDLGMESTFANYTKSNQNGEDVVQVMTIHAAKGLESPVVFLVDTGSLPQNRRTYKTVINWPAEAARPKQFFIIGRKESIDQNTQKILEQQKQDDWQEELNLLYVALTRARQYLFISGVQTKYNKERNWFTVIEQAVKDAPRESESDAWVFNHGDPPDITAEPHDNASPKANLVTNINQPFAPIVKQNDTVDDSSSIDTKATDYGTLVHKMFEWVDRDILQNSNTTHTELDALRVETELALAREVGTKEFATAVQEVKRCLEASELQEIFLSRPEKDILSEVPVCFMENGKALYRIIDRLIVTEDSVWIIDFKTSAAVTIETMSRQAANYREQISSYISAVTKLYPDKKIRASILFTHLPALYDYHADMEQ